MQGLANMKLAGPVFKPEMKGRIIGVIDLETLALDSTRAPDRNAAALLVPARPANWPMPAVAERSGAGLADNFVAAPFEQQPPSIWRCSICAIRRSAWPVAARARYTWGVRNLSGQTVRNVPVVLRTGGKTIWTEVLAELKPSQYERLSVDLTIHCSAEYLTEVEVNPDRTIDERRQYANNSLKQQVWVGDGEESGNGDRPVRVNP
jgi:hypothetical protein